MISILSHGAVVLARKRMFRGVVLLFSLGIGGILAAQPQSNIGNGWYNGPPGEVLSFELGENSMCVVAGADTRNSFTQSDATCEVVAGGGIAAESGEVSPSLLSYWTVSVGNMSCKTECSDIQDGVAEQAYFFTGELTEAENGELAQYNFSNDDYSMRGRVTCLLVSLEFPANKPGRRICEFSQDGTDIQLSVDNAICEWICLDEGLS